MSEHAAELHEPWPDLERQKEAYAFGTWVFLASEALLFGGLFFAYSILRHRDPAAVARAAHEASVWFGTANTAVLLTSSLAVAVAERAVQAGARRVAGRCLWAALLLGLAFLAIKGLEYREDLSKSLFPNAAFALGNGAARLFWGFYWIATGLHAIHVSVGLLLLARLIHFAWRGSLAAHENSVQPTALYWHLVDLIWVVLYALIYLVGRP